MRGFYTTTKEAEVRSMLGLPEDYNLRGDGETDHVQNGSYYYHYGITGAWWSVFLSD